MTTQPNDLPGQPVQDLEAYRAYLQGSLLAGAQQFIEHAVNPGAWTLEQLTDPQTGIYLRYFDVTTSAGRLRVLVLAVD